MILGLDISTNCTGWTVMNNDRSIVQCNFINTSKGKDWMEKVEIFEEEIENSVLNKFKVEKIGIEEILSKFAGGRSTAKTITSLARFNGIATYILKNKTNISPIHINVIRARSLADFKKPKASSLDTKDFILNRCTELYPEIDWPKMKRVDKLASQCYDIADSICIARATTKL